MSISINNEQIRGMLNDDASVIAHNYSVSPALSAEINNSELFKQLNQDEICSMKEVIEEINKLVEERGVLSSDVIADCDKAKCTVENVIKSAPDEAVNEKVALEKEKVSLEEFKLQERINCWRDVALLKKELRERIKEFRDKENSVNMLDSILG